MHAYKPQVISAAPKRRPSPLSVPLSTTLKAAMMAALTGALALVQVPLPFSPVPITGQTLGVMLAGTICGPWGGALSMLGYLALGCLGFPVFAGGQSGLATLAGPTGGYLLGFAIGAWTTGILATWTRTRKHLFLANIVGAVVVLNLSGIVYLSWSARMPLAKAFMLGTAPFLPGDIIKASVATQVGKRLRTAQKRLDIAR
ncbi:MAG: biotin transporter BioY [Bacillota bacterium]